MDTKKLEDIGFSKNEIILYLTLLKLGKTTTTKIHKETNISISAIYYALENLIKKGLINYILIGNKKNFQANNPEKIIDLLESKKQEIKKILPELKALQKNNKEQIETNIYEGYKGIKGIYDEILRTLKKGETYYVIGARQIGDNSRIDMNLMLQNFHKQREERGIRVDIIFNKDVEQETKKIIKNYKLMKAKFKEIKTNSAILIYNNKIINILFTQKLMATETKSKEAYKSYKQYFKEMWNSKEK